MSPGDIILILNGERGLLNAGIRWAQYSALRNLGATKTDAKRCAAYTHAAMALDGHCFGELYYPHARCRQLASLPRGTQYTIRRFREACAHQCVQAAAACQESVEAREPYATSELLYYWFRWAGPKLALRRSFANVFRNRRYDVCSGAVVRWAHAGNLMLGEVPEAWYPARLAYDLELFATVEVCEA